MPVFPQVKLSFGETFAKLKLAFFCCSHGPRVRCVWKEHRSDEGHAVLGQGQRSEKQYDGTFERNDESMLKCCSVAAKI